MARSRSWRTRHRHAVWDVRAELRDDAPSLTEHATTLGEVVRVGKARTMGKLAAEKMLPERKFLDAAAAMLTPGGADAEGERHDHVHLMTLFGDPLLKLSYPAAMKLETPANVVCGEKVRVQLDSPLAGECQLELCFLPGQMASAAKQRDKFDASDAALVAFQKTYEQNLNASLCSSRQQIIRGPQSLELASPPTCPAGTWSVLGSATTRVSRWGHNGLRLAKR